MIDLSSQTHNQLDNDISSNGLLCNASVELHGAGILNYVLVNSWEAYAEMWPLDKTKIAFNACRDLLTSRPDIKSLLKTAHADKKYAKIRSLPEFHQVKIAPKQFISEERRAATEKLLYRAYTQPFRGENASQFLKYLVETDTSVRRGEVVYAKSISIVQSSGTGKSRMLTEIGKQIFTLPICLRGPNDEGYPLADHAVYEYFMKLHNNNDLSISAHSAIARFIGAAHKTMLEWLQKAHTDRNAGELLSYWHNLMEGAVRTERERFFQEVVKLANSMTSEGIKISSPRRRADHDSDTPGFDIHNHSDDFYDKYAKQATEDLAKFTSSLTPQWPIAVTYIDEAHVLDESLWSMLRLLSRQDVTTPMLYCFAATKSSISYFNPAPGDRHSGRLRKERMRLLPPYIAVGFDQIVISEDRDDVNVKMGELQSIKHLAKYGRPLWNAQYDKDHVEQIRLAANKLICQDFQKFNPTDQHQVLAVLSQRVCVDMVLFSSEALRLADRSVASHMKLLTGFAPDQQTFYTYSPSEPMLALAAAQLLYNEKRDVLGKVLATFSTNLCEAGLVEKGLMGELAARTLLTIARDLAAPRILDDCTPNLLTPVLLMDFINKLFGNESWCAPHQADFRNAFKDTYVNFTHWMVTKDLLPEKPSKKLLANLWARGAALQCYFNQESLDLQIVTYKGSIAPDAIFDIKNLSVAIFQIKHKSKALCLLRPIGLHRDLRAPLPYLAMVMELGNESNYQNHTGPIRVTLPPKRSKGAFKALRVAWNVASDTLSDYDEKVKRKKKDPERTKLLEEVKTARAEMDAYNRYTINARGASSTTYGSLVEANIVAEFANLIKVTMPSPSPQKSLLQHMRPLERLGEGSAHNAWMQDYGSLDDDEDEDEDDGAEDDGVEDVLMNPAGEEDTVMSGV